ncbi:MAG: OadG family transporter subunit [Candidatus Neomarinimicrobiota bacterium]
MKRKLVILAIGLLPICGYALGIPEENRSLVFSVTLIGIFTVLLALAVVAMMVGLMSKIIDRVANRKEYFNKTKKEPLVNIVNSDAEIVAIATALHLELRSLQEEEKAVLTIRKEMKPFLAWNNKIYGMRSK